MKKIINDEGFKKAMDEGKVWVTLQVELTELKNGKWYWEIEKSVFKDNDASWDALAHGTDDASFETVSQIWENFIKKNNPDECFVEQNDYQDIDYQELSDKLDREAEGA